MAGRIMIFGGSVSGKSTLALDIGARTGVPVVHIDHFYWAPGWVQGPCAETTALSPRAMEEECRIFEGNHSPTMAARAERADLLIFLDMPRWRGRRPVLHPRSPRAGRRLMAGDTFL